MTTEYERDLAEGYARGVEAERARIVALIEAELAQAKGYIEWFEKLPGPQQYSYEDDAAGSRGTVRVLDYLLEKVRE
jgi:hypothetical protein